MNLALLRWLRLVAPPLGLVIVLLAWCGVMEGLYLWIGWAFGRPPVSPRFFVARDMGCLIAAVYLGAYRVTAFHPLFDAEYFSWLSITPWRYDKPLPRGPVHLVPQDVLMVGAIAALMLHQPVVPPVIAPLAFFVSYYLALALCLWCVDLRWAGYALSALVGLMIAASYRSPLAALGLAGLIYIPAYAAIRWSLSTFPWSARVNAFRNGVTRQWQIFTAGHRQFGTAPINLEAPEHEVQWPFNVLNAKVHPAFFGKDDRLALALLTGWWAWVVFSAPRAEGVAMGVGSMLYMSLLGMVLAMRLGMYCMNYRPPISLWGRIFTMRWIIPGYDRVFLTPLATLGLGVSVPYFLITMNHGPALVLGLSLPPFLIAGLLGGPSLLQWRMTSPARLVPGARNQQLVEEI